MTVARQAAKTLTARDLATKRKAGYVAAGGSSGLYLQTSKTGTKSWVFRFKRNGVAREMGLGSLEKVGLAKAREDAKEAWQKLNKGVDPIEEKRRAKAAMAVRQWTFGQCAEGCIQKEVSGWKNPRTAKLWRSSLETYAYPTLGHMLVGEVSKHSVAAVLEPIWLDKTTTALLLRSRIEQVLRWSMANDHRLEGPNPARLEAVKDLLPTLSKEDAKPVHRLALPYKDVAAFMPKLRAVKGSAARCLEFLILTAARSGEVRFATWDEIKFESKVWAVPAKRMKMSRPHEVPLSDQAIRLLRALPTFAETGLVFPATRGKAMRDNTLSQVTLDLKAGCVPHGFRTSIRTWLTNETDCPHDIAEHVLAHATGNASEQAYNRVKPLERRRVYMQAWSDYLDRPATTATVTNIKRKARS